MSPRHAPDGPVVVVGGGIAGLATAALLAREGREVTLVEATDQVGGRGGVPERLGTVGPGPVRRRALQRPAGRHGTTERDRQRGRGRRGERWWRGR